MRVTLVEMGFVSASLVALHENTAPSSSMLGVKVNTLVVAAIFSLTDDVVVLELYYVIHDIPWAHAGNKQD